MESEKTKQARERIQQMLKENPSLAKAYKETIEEMRKPEHLKQMAESIQYTMQKWQEMVVAYGDPDKRKGLLTKIAEGNGITVEELKKRIKDRKIP